MPPASLRRRPPGKEVGLFLRRYLPPKAAFLIAEFHSSALKCALRRSGLDAHRRFASTALSHGGFFPSILPPACNQSGARLEGSGLFLSQSKRAVGRAPVSPSPCTAAQLHRRTMPSTRREGIEVCAICLEGLTLPDTRRKNRHALEPSNPSDYRLASACPCEWMACCLAANRRTVCRG